MRLIKNIQTSRSGAPEFMDPSFLYFKSQCQSCVTVWWQSNEVQDVYLEVLGAIVIMA